MLPTPAAGLWIQRRRPGGGQRAPAVICELNDDVDVGDGGQRRRRHVGAHERVIGKLARAATRRSRPECTTSEHGL